MKHIFGLFLALCSVGTMAQYPITGISITLPSQPAANTADWATSSTPLLIMAQAKLVNGKVPGNVSESRILLTIKSGGTKVCGSYTQTTAPVSLFNSATKTWSGAVAIGLLGTPCTLKPGSYELCVQFFGTTGITLGALSAEICKPFTIADSKQITYSPPQNIMPVDGKILSDKEVKQPVMFRWTPVTPKPKEDVIYKLRIFEVRAGQSLTNAARSGKWLLEKEIKNQTQYSLPTLSTISIPKGSNYGWLVQATNGKGNPYGSNNGSSAPWILKSGSSNCSHEANIDSIFCMGLNNGLPQYRICLTYKNTNTDLNCSNCEILLNHQSNQQPSSLVPAGTTIASLSPNTIINSIEPGVPAVLPAGQQTTICFIATLASGNNLNFIILAVCNDNALSTIPNNENEPFDTIPQPCICNDCDSLQWNFTEPVLTTQTPYSPNPNNTAFLTQGIAVTPNQVIKVTAELINFNWVAPADCKRCDTNSFNWGNIISGTIQNNGFATNGTPVSIPNGLVLLPLQNSHFLQWTTTSGPATLAGTINLNISLPPQTELECCTDCFKFCIRYNITFIEDGKCKSCSMVRCYTLIRKHHPLLPAAAGLDACGEINSPNSNKSKN